jgi:biotin carboxylase
LNSSAPHLVDVSCAIETSLAPDSIGIWFTQAHSCQRDLILAAKQAQATFSIPLHIVASHPDLRPEITAVADVALQEPVLSQRVEWLLAHAQRLQVKLIIAGRYGALYLAHQARFAQLGIRLMAGCDDATSLAHLHDKAEFTQRCQQQQIAVVPATKVETADQLQAAYEAWAKLGEVCVKPVHGVFAAGFWHLDPKANAFDAFANSQNYTTHPQSFIDSYRLLQQPPAYLVMPYLSELECSVDMFCVHGQVRQAVARYKHRGEYQSLHLVDPAIELARQVAGLFACDGLVNMQARYDQHGQLYILEVNPRPSGGIGHSFFSGLNLVLAAIADTFDLDYIREPNAAVVMVRQVSHCVPVSSRVLHQDPADAVLIDDKPSLQHQQDKVV